MENKTEIKCDAIKTDRGYKGRVSVVTNNTRVWGMTAPEHRATEEEAIKDAETLSYQLKQGV